MFFGKKQNIPVENNGDDAKESLEAFVFIHKALLVVDGSQPSMQATEFAIKFARQTGCELVAAYIVDTATLDYLLQMHIFVEDEREELEHDLENKGRRYLASVEAQGKEAGVLIKSHLCSGRFHQSILHIASELQVEVIIIGGWKNEIKQKDASSVERQLIMDLAECPVIVVKKKSAAPRH